ncbi:unnamed protein product, partial [Scytosiphon promiscuus]
MSFSAPAFVGSAGASQSLGDSIVAARLKEKKFQQSRNKILGAGRGHVSDGTPAANASVDKGGSSSSWSTYDMGPDTQDVAELQALAATKWAKQNPPLATTAKPDRPEWIDLGDDSDQESTGQELRRGGHQGDARDSSSAEKKRKRRNNAVATSGKEGPREGQAAMPRGEVSGENVFESNRRRHRRRRSLGRPVIVLLGCDARELERARPLCERLGQRLETQLVSEATHVVVGSLHTRARTSSGGGGGEGGCGAAGADDGRGGARRHELRTHGLRGYRESVMLGLWVMDFSWVDACLRADRGALRDKGAPPDDRFEPSLQLPPPRDFELLGCSKKHEGCEPRRGRYKRGSGLPGVFDGMAFHVVVGDADQLSRDPDISRSRSEAERLLKLGGGVILAPSRLKKPPPVRAGYVDDPFGEEDPPEPREEVVDVDLGSEGNAAAAKGKKVVVLALPDRSDGPGNVGPKLAEVAIRTRERLGAVAA